MAEAPAPSNKRKRADSEPPQPIQPVWLPYGDIVLEVESVQFRVNRDVLARQSTVFADMLSVPQPPDADTLDGVPIVQLAGDSAKDWTLLLDVVYDPYKYGEQIPLEVIEVMLKLGQKYDMHGIRKHAVSHIHLEFPNNLKAYDKLRILSYGAWKPTRIKPQPGLEVELLNVVDTYGINTSLPALALLCLKLHSLECLTNNKVRRKDGSRIFLHKRLKLMLGVAAEKIVVHQRAILRWLEFDNDTIIPAAFCLDECLQERGVIHRELTEGWAGHRYLLLALWQDVDDSLLCDRCQDAAKEEWNSWRASSWSLLPGFFGLPKWKELKDTE
ncbi:hypothetical protein C8F01DRAFT_1058173 [Mycena amicta]|nr:hypothetical protein C8F01DRAFT_1058173 [Mycena amicta]